MWKTAARALLIGTLTGFLVWGFLHSLLWVTRAREAVPMLIWGLPLAGAWIGWFHKHGRGSDLPGIWISTLATHLCGGSAGREAAAVQITTGAARLLPESFFGSEREKQDLLLASAAAGFAATVGAPLSGLLFAWERSGSLRMEGHRRLALVVAVAAALGAGELLSTKHLIFPHFEIQRREELPALIAGLFLGILPFGFLAIGFERGTSWLRRHLQLRWPRPALRGAVGGLALLLLYLSFDSAPYQGLGIETLLSAFERPAPVGIFWFTPVVKLLLTGITLAAGFKGGEFIPLFFMGAAAGGALSTLAPDGGGAALPTAFLPALGCILLYATAGRSPFTGLALAAELFGIHLVPFAGAGILVLRSIQRRTDRLIPSGSAIPPD